MHPFFYQLKPNVLCFFHDLIAKQYLPSIVLHGFWVLVCLFYEPSCLMVLLTAVVWVLYWWHVWVPWCVVLWRYSSWKSIRHVYGLSSFWKSWSNIWWQNDKTSFWCKHSRNCITSILYFYKNRHIHKLWSVFMFLKVSSKKQTMHLLYLPFMYFI